VCVCFIYIHSLVFSLEGRAGQEPEPSRDRYGSGTRVKMFGEHELVLDPVRILNYKLKYLQKIGKPQICATEIEARVWYVIHVRYGFAVSS